MALIVGGATFDRPFAGAHFDEVDGDILFVYAKNEKIVYAKNEKTASEMEDNFALHISIIRRQSCALPAPSASCP